MVRIRRSNDPVFSAHSYAFTVPEDASQGTVVGTVSADDPNDGPLTYSITDGNERGDFSIDPRSGQITVAAAHRYETVSSYSLTVHARNAAADAATWR